MTAHAPDPQDPVQIIARFVRGNWDMPEQVGAGLIEELASEGWIITRAQVFNDMLEALKQITDELFEANPGWNSITTPDSVVRGCAAIAKATGST